MPQTITNPNKKPTCDASLCKTETFFDRDVELVVCKESKNCAYKKQHNKMTICLCR